MLGAGLSVRQLGGGRIMTVGQATGKVTFLDCTLRDGGYYNNWDFPRPVVLRYVNAMAAARVPVVEIGFRTTSTSGFQGPAAYSTDSYLESLDLPEGPSYGVMVNGAEFAAAEDPVTVTDALFDKSAHSPVELVRIAAHFRELERLEPALGRLHDLGYKVGLNLMQIASRTESEIAQFGEIATRASVDVAYIADSFGGMKPEEVQQVLAQLRVSYDGPLGCHMHNNMSLGFANTMAGIEAGATYVDATVLGMGRGPGNAQTEYLAVELARQGLADLDVVPLLPIVAGDFAELQSQYGWGANAYYFMSAAHGIHPTYIQEMTKDGRYTIDEIVAAVGQLSADGGASFSRRRLEAAASEAGLIDPDGSWDATGWCDGRRVLIVGPGPEGEARRDDIESYIRHTQPLVIALNAKPPVDESLVDVFAICHPVRAMIDADIIKDLGQRVVMPRGIQSRIGISDGDSEFLDYGIAADEDQLLVGPSSCILPKISAFPYALALAAAGGATEVQLTGFDGFDSGDDRQAEMEKILWLFTEQPAAVPVVALTPTSYAIERRSVYAPVD